MPPGMKKKLENVIENSFPVSIKLIKKMQEMGIEIGRRAKLGDMLIRIGHSKDNDLIKNVLIRCLEEQREDGGWGTIEETLICLRFIAHFREDRNISIRINKAIRWLFLVKNPSVFISTHHKYSQKTSRFFKLQDFLSDFGRLFALLQPSQLRLHQ
jgi:hypothetical protein